MAKLLRLTFIAALAGSFVSCATAPGPIAAAPAAPRQKVRTTAYTHNEGTGSRNAVGRRLAGGGIRSAASDWSRFPLGTHFRVCDSGEEYIIDDYGGALVGTNTIDLYKPSTLEMRRWGVRHVDIEVLRWGSDEESLKVLRPRRGAGSIRRMIAAIQNKKPSPLPR
jgi:3D (Asp-Asp-Asp) domain-containing protein